MDIVTNGRTLMTNGLAGYRQPEIRLKLIRDESVREGEALLRYVADYLVGSGTTVRSLDAIPYGCWSITFVIGRGNCLDIWEHNAIRTEFREGARLALTYWREQHEVCAGAGAAFCPPKPDQGVTVSDCVFYGGAAKGVRESSPPHMSGWSIVSARYDDRVASLREQPLYHLTSRRPGLARYLALPSGFRFDLSSGEMIWLNEDLAGT